MKNLSVKLKVTIWFSVIMIFIIAATFCIILWASSSVMQKNIQDNLVETVEDNIDEIEFFKEIKDSDPDGDDDQYIAYKDGFLEIDDDFLDKVNGVFTALYQEDGKFLYGENPLAIATEDIAFSDRIIHKVKSDGVIYYVFDCKLTSDGTEELWLRGFVSENQGTQQLTSIIRISAVALPTLLLLAVTGGYWIASRALRPVQKITEAASQISHGSDLNKRIGLGKGNDELHRLANVFDDMFSRLDEAFKTEQQFISDASHELRTPMSVILAQCEYILEQPRSNEEYAEAFTVIQRQGRKMSRLIEDMLCFARMEQNEKSYPLEKLDLTELVNDVCSDMSLIRDKNITLKRRVRSDVFVSGNRMLLTRLLTNLISNAYRYGRENGEIIVTLDMNEEILLQVEDNGIGIPEDQQKKIFERFYRADQSRNTEGTGLGLAMVKDIADYHGGNVEVSSKTGTGSIFSVRFPRL
ncbi:ATP-binding protein [Ruminococcus sp. Marseille-P6503]|uniref:sensor histidine kinase n=1 Tax=Ruminococcus sp. Marseille-P6503 TaxID=2364796 RepID=UPI000F52FCF3|nr:ATP-binding protein [Ruminococcus sp. Marseille-P6503]